MSAIPSTLESTQLLGAVRAGNSDAFADAVRPYSSILYRRALRLTGNSADAEDVRQEALLKAYSRLEQFTGKEAESNNDFRAWVSRIAENTAIDLIRRRRTAKLVSLQEPVNSGQAEPAGVFGDLLTAQIHDRRENPEDQMARRELRAHMARSVARLAPDLRQVCLLRDVLQYSTQEVADRLGISAVAVRLRLFRAHRRLREDLQDLLRPEKREAARKQARPASRTAQERPAPRRHSFLSLPALPECACGD